MEYQDLMAYNGENITPKNIDMRVRGESSNENEFVFNEI